MGFRNLIFRVEGRGRNKISIDGYNELYYKLIKCYKNTYFYGIFFEFYI